MKKKFAAFLCMVLLAGSMPSLLGAQSMADDQKERIAMSCVTAKDAIRRLQKSDALLRINRGQVYESINLRLMSKFNTRVESNGYSVRSLSAVTEFYTNALNEFRSDYQDYAKKLEATLGIDCTKDQEKFLLGVQEARSARQKLHTATTKLNQTIGEYRSAFDAFVVTFVERSTR